MNVVDSACVQAETQHCGCILPAGTYTCADSAAETFAYCPTPCPVNYGQTVAGGTYVSYKNAGRAAGASNVTVGLSGYVLSLSVYIYIPDANGSVELGLYSDAGGKPGFLLAHTVPFLGNTGGYNTVPIAGSPPHINAGLYWLAAETNSTTLRFLLTALIGDLVYAPAPDELAPSFGPETVDSTTLVLDAYLTLQPDVCPTAAPTPVPTVPMVCCETTANYYINTNTYTSDFCNLVPAGSCATIAADPNCCAGGCCVTDMGCFNVTSEDCTGGKYLGTSPSFNPGTSCCDPLLAPTCNGNGVTCGTPAPTSTSASTSGGTTTAPLQTCCVGSDGTCSLTTEPPPGCSANAAGSSLCYDNCTTVYTCCTDELVSYGGTNTNGLQSCALAAVALCRTPAQDPTCCAPESTSSAHTSTAASTSGSTSQPTTSPSTHSSTSQPTTSPSTHSSTGGSTTTGASTCQVNFGQTVADPNPDLTFSYHANEPAASSVTVSLAGDVVSLSVYIYNVDAMGAAEIGLYSDMGGQPGSLLARTAPFNTANGFWNTEPVVDGPVLIAAGVYWLAVDTNSTAVTFLATPYSAPIEYAAPSADGTLPATWSPSSTSAFSSQLDAYLTLQPEVCPTGTTGGSTSGSTTGGTTTGSTSGSTTGASTSAPSTHSSTAHTTAASCVMARFGDQSTGTTAANASAHVAVASQLTVGVDGTARQLSVYLVHSSALPFVIVLGLYSDEGGTPNTLLASTALSQVTAHGWQTATLSAPVDVQAGTVYWLAVLADAAIGIGTVSTGPSTEIAYDTSIGTSLELPPHWSGTQPPLLYELSTYVTVDVGACTTAHTTAPLTHSSTGGTTLPSTGSSHSSTGGQTTPAPTGTTTHSSTSSPLTCCGLFDESYTSSYVEMACSVVTVTECDANLKNVPDATCCGAGDVPTGSTCCILKTLLTHRNTTAAGCEVLTLAACQNTPNAVLDSDCCGTTATGNTATHSSTGGKTTGAITPSPTSHSSTGGTTTHSSTGHTTPSPTTGHTTGATTPSPTSPGTCDEVADATRCGVRPGCVGGTRDGLECYSNSECPGSGRCIQFRDACRAIEPCLGCTATNASNARRACDVCVADCTTAERMSTAVRQYPCCPASLSGTVAPPAPARACSPATGFTSACGRAYDCWCRAEPCFDAADTHTTLDPGCHPQDPEELCGDALIADGSNIAHNGSHVVLCTDDPFGESTCGDGTHDFYLFNVTQRRIILAVPASLDANLIVQLSAMPVVCPSTSTVLVTMQSFTSTGTFEGSMAIYYIQLSPTAPLGVYAVRVAVTCSDWIAPLSCVPYNLTLTNAPPLCPEAICALPTCVSSRDCDAGAYSCFACDARLGRCFEHAGDCADEDCVAAGELADTCADASAGVLCRICTNGTDVCTAGRCEAAANGTLACTPIDTYAPPPTPTTSGVTTGFTTPSPTTSQSTTYATTASTTAQTTAPQVCCYHYTTATEQPFCSSTTATDCAQSGGVDDTFTPGYCSTPETGCNLNNVCCSIDGTSCSMVSGSSTCSATPQCEITADGGCVAAPTPSPTTGQTTTGSTSAGHTMSSPATAPAGFVCCFNDAQTGCAFIPTADESFACDTTTSCHIETDGRCVQGARKRHAGYVHSAAVHALDVLPAPADPALTFDCDCVCAQRQCHSVNDCPLSTSPTLRRYCDRRTGSCGFIGVPAPTSGVGVQSALVAARASDVQLDGTCAPAALDAAERSYTAYAMDRFGSIDRSSGARRPALCGSTVDTLSLAVDSSAPAALQAACCAASGDWQSTCAEPGTASGRLWADRAWLALHSAHTRAQAGQTLDAARSACCAAWMLAALGSACGRTRDSWALATTHVVRPSGTGPTIQAYEDGHGDGDTNDWVLYVRRVELRDSRNDLVAANTHTYPLARGGAYRASFALAFGANGTSAGTPSAAACPDRDRRLAHSVLDQSATRAQLTALATPPAGLFVGTLRHAVGASDGALPLGVAAAECATFGAAGTPACAAAGSALVVLYRDTASALPLLRESAADALADTVAYHEPVVNTQSGTRYQSTLYGASAVAIAPPRSNATARYLLRNLDCGVLVLLGDTSTADSPLAVEVPADGGALWRWSNEGVRLMERPNSTDRVCLSGPLSGSLQCSNDNVCDGGVCAAPAARTGVPYPYAAAAADCAARRVPCPSSDACCTDEVQRWYLYAARSSALVYQPRTE